MQQPESSREVGTHHCAAVAFKLPYSAILYAWRLPSDTILAIKGARCYSVTASPDAFTEGGLLLLNGY